MALDLISGFAFQVEAKLLDCICLDSEPALKDSVAILRIDDHSGISTLCL